MFIAIALSGLLAITAQPAKPAPQTGGEVLVPRSPNQARMNAGGELARCTAMVDQTLYEHGIRPDVVPLAPMQPQTWRPSAYPEAGLYSTVYKKVAGCTVPVPMSFHRPAKPKP